METPRSRRPVFLNLFLISQPVGAIASITHRITGVLLVLLLMPSIYLLDLSLRGPQDYAGVAGWLASGTGRAAILIVTWLMAQHFFSGIRSLFLDLDIGVAKRRARLTAALTFCASIVTVLVVGLMLV